MKLRDLTAGEILLWNDVSDIHKVRNGIYQLNGRLISLLTDFGRINPCYPDHEGADPDTIHYHGYGRHGNQKLDAANRSLFDAIRSGHSVPLFNKLAVGRWEFVGLVRIHSGEYLYDEGQQRMVWQFTLKKVLERSRQKIRSVGQ